ncbi:muramoyltetrapeptide carboxypeptidase [Undibacterium sp. KW1]|uniref:LD-carboxypeptidase n=1 Tax=Undibacterium sp. KW1 TaxID=2058624 RepID=UPI001331E2F4|nr:LD-carboxypeptidase [Undibacterium sp. KW1]BBB60966.1 muramoyltetrapeptide carboxypeptidase [Undibacterium sp. KW1]
MPGSSTQTGIAIIAPSGAPLDDSLIERGLQRLAGQGFKVHSYYDADAKFQRFGATDAERARQIHEAAQNPDVQIIMALRGSYGMSRLMPLLDFDLLANSGKCFVGYSDFTLVHLAMLARGRTSIAGPMLCDDYVREQPVEYTLQQFHVCVSNTMHTVEFETATEQDLHVEGKLWGGNLAMLTHAVGTPYWAEVEDGILFLEDIGEHPYRIERMLLQLHFAGVLSKQKAIVLGNFSAYKLAVHDNGYDFNAMLAYIRSVIDVPVIIGLPFGHISTRASLVVGSEAQLDVEVGRASLVMNYNL